MKKGFLCVLLGLFLVLPDILDAHPWGGLVIDSEGRIYFTFICPMVDDEAHRACVWELDAQGQLQPALQAERSPSDIILARDPRRTIYGAERDGMGSSLRARLWKLRPDRSHELVIPPTMDPRRFTIQAYTIDAGGTLYYAQDAQLFKRTPEGQVEVFAGMGEGHQDGQGAEASFTRIGALAWGPDSTLYAIDRGHLRTLTKDGRVSTVATGLREEDPEDLPFSGANIIFDLAVDEQGNAYIAYFGNRRILKVTPEGEVTTLLRSEGRWSPHGVDVYDGDLYVLETTIGGQRWWEFWKDSVLRPRVRKLAADGTVETVYEYVVGN